LQFGELPVFRGVVGKLIVGEDSPWNNVRAHRKSAIWKRVACYVSVVSILATSSGRRLEGPPRWPTRSDSPCQLCSHHPLYPLRPPVATFVRGGECSTSSVPRPRCANRSHRQTHRTSGDSRSIAGEEPQSHSASAFRDTLSLYLTGGASPPYSRGRLE
jgi:hypothetical protein